MARCLASRSKHRRRRITAKAETHTVPPSVMMTQRIISVEFFTCTIETTPSQPYPYPFLNRGSGYPIYSPSTGRLSSALRAHPRGVSPLYRTVAPWSLRLTRIGHGRSGHKQAVDRGVRAPLVHIQRHGAADHEAHEVEEV
jgi:hypothetical protein